MYQYNYEPYATIPGIKFELGQIPKDDRKAVENGGVYLPDKNGEEGYLGSVKNFSGTWHKALPLSPGTYKITIALVDGRKLDMNVTVQPQHITKVALRFEKPPEDQ
jgi:hypothetical protein